MRWGRKEPRGRHGLGAAVTAIPTAPPRPADVPILADQPWSERYAPPRDVEPVVVTRAPVPDLPVVAVPAVPEAVVPPPAVVVPPRVPMQPAPALPLPDLPVQASSLDDADRPPVQAPPLPALPVQAVPEPDPIETALLDVLRQAPLLPPATAGPRVELGFADGTFRMLDPASSAAQALSDLVDELLGNDAVPRPTAS